MRRGWTPIPVARLARIANVIGPSGAAAKAGLLVAEIAAQGMTPTVWWDGGARIVVQHDGPPSPPEPRP